ncbi:MAG: hypothetical protein VW999_15170 [Alphaproteobacteria bacterium]
MSDLLLFVGLIALWVIIAWVIFRRVGFFGAQKPPRFSLVKDGRTFDSATSTYLLNGISGGRHLVFVFQAPDGVPFVYHSRDKDVQLLDGDGVLEAYVRDHCGAEKGLKALHDAQARIAKKA